MADENETPPAPPAETPPAEAPAPAETPAPVPEIRGPHGELPEPREPAPLPEPPKPRLVEPRVGQRVKIHLPERKTAGGKPIRVMRPGNPPRPYVEGEVVRWDDHFVSLRAEGAVHATEIVEE